MWRTLKSLVRSEVGATDRRIFWGIAFIISLLVVLSVFGIVPVRLPGGPLGWLAVAVLIIIVAGWPGNW